jgi:hypothetical protein
VSGCAQKASATPPRQPIVRWLTSPLVRLGVLLLLFLWPWRAVGRAWSHVVVGLARLFLATRASVAFRYPPGTGDDAWRLRVVADDLTSGRFVETALDLRRAGFIAIAVFAALVLATPLRWRRRAGMLAIGLVPLLVLPLLPMIALFSGAVSVRAFDLGPLAHTAVSIAYRVLVTAPGMAFALPGLLWLLLIWRFEPAWLRYFVSTWIASEPTTTFGADL